MISNGSMSGSRSGTLATSMSMPTSPLEAISRGRGGQPRGAEVLQRDEQPALQQLQRALQQLLLLERVAHLHGRALGVVASPPVARARPRRAPRRRRCRRGRSRRRTARRTLPGAGGRAAHQPLARREAERHRVDQAVLLVGPLEVDLAADGRHADRVAVVADARHRAVEQVARARAGRPRHELAEAQRVEHRDRARADREDVAQDAADAGRRALEGLDRARVVVGLDLERAHQPAADVDRAGVLAGAHHHVLALGRQRAQQLLGVLVGAVLAPQQRVHRQLHLVRRPALLLAHELVLRAREAERERVLDASGSTALRHRATSACRVPVPAPAMARPSTCAPSTARRIDSKIAARRLEPPSARRPRARGGASARTRCRARCARRRCRAASR